MCFPGDSPGDFPGIFRCVPVLPWGLQVCPWLPWGLPWGLQVCPCPCASLGTSLEASGVSLSFSGDFWRVLVFPWDLLEVTQVSRCVPADRDTSAGLEELRASTHRVMPVSSACPRSCPGAHLEGQEQPGTAWIPGGFGHPIMEPVPFGTRGFSVVSRGIQGGIGSLLPKLASPSLPCPQQQQQGLSQPDHCWVSPFLISTSSCCAQCTGGCSWHSPASPGPAPGSAGGASWTQTRAGSQKHSGGEQGAAAAPDRAGEEGWS